MVVLFPLVINEAVECNSFEFQSHAMTSILST